ncbi:MAG TPA: nickel transporter permease [Bacillota bacterium]|jgi:peptide/nickel transport system permease protein
MSATEIGRTRASASLQALRYDVYLVKKSLLTMIGLFIVCGLVLVALLAPVIAPYPGDARSEVHTERSLLAPSLQHPFGTDEMGRDIFSRVVYGSRISLGVGIFTIGLALLIGVPLGLLAGFVGGGVDEVIMRVTDVFLSFPPLLLATAISAMLGPNLVNAMIAIAIAWWPWYTRLIRGQAIALRERGFVEAARATGVSPIKIIFRHVLPNAIAPIIVQASMDFGSIILEAASLSFLGLGAQPPQPEWGLTVSIGRNFFMTNWWYVTFPGLAIFLTVLGFNFVGDGLREILDPKTREV